MGCACVHNSIGDQKCLSICQIDKTKKNKENFPYNQTKNSNNNSNNQYRLRSTDNNNIDNNSFEMRILQEINFVRVNPKLYAEKIIEMLKYVKREGEFEYFHPKGNKRILLENGTEIFDQTVKFLNKMTPVKALSWNKEIQVEFNNSLNLIDKHTTTILSNELIGRIILEKRLKIVEKYKNCYFNIDIFSDPIISVLFQVTDETFKQERRNALLNKDFSFFAVNYVQDSKNKFMSISSFA